MARVIDLAAYRARRERRALACTADDILDSPMLRQGRAIDAAKREAFDRWTWQLLSQPVIHDDVPPTVA